jgi:hypothetical protein
MTSVLHPTLFAAVANVQKRLATHFHNKTSIDESNTIRLFVDPIISALGWDLLDLDEVKSEYRHKPSDNPVDYALLQSGRPVLFIEAKGLNKNLEDRKWISQTINYANTANVEWTVLTNGIEWRVYKTHAPVEANEKLFYTTTLTSQSIEECVHQLLPLGKDKFTTRNELGALWETSMVDTKILAVLQDIQSHPSVVRAIAKAAGLGVSDTQRGLDRIVVTERVFQTLPLFPTMAQALPAPAPPVENDIPTDVASPKQSGGTDATVSLEKVKPSWTSIGTQDLLEAGLLVHGMELLVVSNPHHPALVENGKFCLYNGTLMTYSAWGKAVTGWKGFDTFMQIQTASGRLLQDLRLELNEQRQKK